MPRRGRPRAALNSVMPTRERAQHDLLVIETPQNEGGAGDIRQRTRVAHALKLDALCNRRVITEDQRDAGLAFRGLYFRAYGTQSLISSYDDMIAQGSIGGAKFTDADAAYHFMCVMRELGQVARWIVYRVCVEDHDISEASAKPATKTAESEILRRGLDVLHNIKIFDNYSI